jgi:hypothetical protein
MLKLINQEIFCRVKPENLLPYSGGLALSQLNPVLIFTFVSVLSDVDMLGENCSLNSNKELIWHPRQVVREKLVYLCLVTGVQGQS